ncbi:hypothetical protein HY385_02415 [Candidatus Daviesbacteria bacterium]|nr:hypothetical protein [Candidatus Daviesbacteria bacterium]
MKWHKVFHYFLPHPQTHQKAHLLSWHYLLIYVLLFLLLRTGLDLVKVFQPGVLGVSSNITVSEIIADTNAERVKNGLPPLQENQALSQAAVAKAQNMFAENYWAHFAPSGKDPWGFIKGAGYRFSFAGENLARNFTNSSDVVKAWMNSPSHKENLLNSNYQEIGIAVVDGTLQGQQTTLVVQMFGKPYQALAIPQGNISGTKVAVENTPVVQNVPVVVSNVAPSVKSASSVLNPVFIIRTFGIGLISFISLLLLVDFIVLQGRGVFRLSSHHLAHLSFLAINWVSLLAVKAGEIL